MGSGKRSLTWLLVLISILAALLFTTLVNLFDWSNLQVSAFLFAVASIFFASMLGTTIVLKNILNVMPKPARTLKEVVGNTQDEAGILLDSAAQYILMAEKIKSMLNNWEETQFDYLQMASFADNVRTVSKPLLGWYFDPVAIHHSYTTVAQKQLAQTLCEAWIALLQQANHPTDQMQLLQMEDFTQLTTGVAKELETAIK